MAAPRQEQLFALLIAIWAGLFTWSLIGFWSAEPTGDGFVRGMNRVTQFLLWQFAAGVFSIPVFVVGRGYPRGGAMRWISRVPLALAAAMVLIIVIIIFWARLG